MQVVGNAYLLEAMAALLTNVFNPSTNHAKIHLAVAPFTPTPSMTPASFTEATFAGYAAVSITGWGTPHFDNQLQALMMATTPALEWTPSASTTPNDIVGYWIQDNAGNVVCAEAFPAPIPLHNPTQTLMFTAGVAYGPYKFTTQIAP
jgi:hypothetical protein